MDEPLNQQAMREELEELAAARMPFGRYTGRRLIDLPEAYLTWFSQRGYPPGQLGQQLRAVYEIKLNGLDSLLRRLK